VSFSSVWSTFPKGGPGGKWELNPNNPPVTTPLKMEMVLLQWRRRFSHASLRSVRPGWRREILPACRPQLQVSNQLTWRSHHVTHLISPDLISSQVLNWPHFVWTEWQWVRREATQFAVAAAIRNEAGRALCRPIGHSHGELKRNHCHWEQMK